MMLEVGKLYSCSEFYLLLYPDQETAFGVLDHQPCAYSEFAGSRRLAEAASYWSALFDKPVGYCNPETPFLVLSVKETRAQVLTGDGIGWIVNRDWLVIEEIVDGAD
jgi:hypothetical protein